MRSKLVDIREHPAAHIASPGIEWGVEAHVEVEECLIRKTNGAVPTDERKLRADWSMSHLVETNWSGIRKNRLMSGRGGWGDSLR